MTENNFKSLEDLKAEGIIMSCLAVGRDDVSTAKSRSLYMRAKLGELRTDTAYHEYGTTAMGKHYFMVEGNNGLCSAYIQKVL